MHMRLARQVFCLAVAGLLAAGCAEPGPTVWRLTGPAQGTTYTVTVVDPPAAVSRNEIDQAIRQTLDEIDAALSTWRQDADISRFNRATSDEWVEVSSMLAGLVQRSLALGDSTDGRFDVTLKPVLALWGFGPGAETPASVPDAAVIEQVLARTGSGRVDVRPTPPGLRKSAADLQLELSGIAQGYSVDALRDLLADRGLDRFLVELGGELYGQGRNPDGRAWQVGVEAPVAGRRDISRVVPLDGQGISTSGDYRDFFELDGQRFSHTIDPTTGRPVTHDLRSVTVLHDSTEMADGLATALLVMGPEAGLAFARERELAALFIRGEEGAYTSVTTKAFDRLTEVKQ
ncbi:FAD:protein FMN transferase [Salinisphaera sp. P385]|uniref:FAD:protein FMN transferase n=1 Tax=Spectribacter acetivorans TaxID=3075603 RepID=A0ABU3B6W8_9GAMM|nr:FAD:protein FMN transferase [Salinisphaera sp. P385]MDT0617865.1 FAD:protein FMN transferase [Salinisphaera sp. P385]